MKMEIIHTIHRYIMLMCTQHTQRDNVHTPTSTLHTKKESGRRKSGGTNCDRVAGTVNGGGNEVAVRSIM